MALRLLSTRLLHSRRYFCDKLWAACSIRWNGDLEPCPCACGETPVHSIPATPFLEAWNSEPYRRTRAYLLAQLGHEIPEAPSAAEAFDICRNCSVPLIDRYSLIRRRLKGMGLALWRDRHGARTAHERELLGRKWDNYRRLLACLRDPVTTVSAYPVLGNIDATNLCNLRCPMCETGSGKLAHPRGMMPFDLYETLLEELGPYLVSLELYRYGEPLLNPRIAEMVRLAARDYRIRTTISSNLSAPVKKDLLEALVDSGLQTLVVAADGCDQATYEKYRRGGSLERVLANLETIVRLRAARKSHTPRIVWQYLIFSHNEHTVDETRRLARRLGVDRFLAVEPSIPHYDSHAGWASKKRGYRGGGDETLHRQVLEASITPVSVPAGEPFALAATIRNTTREPWPADFGASGSVRLGVKLYGAGHQFLHEMGRGLLAQALAPDSEMQIQASLQAPEQPGAYRLKLDMLREGECWYEWKTGHKSNPLWIDLRVL